MYNNSNNLTSGVSSSGGGGSVGGSIIANTNMNTTNNNNNDISIDNTQQMDQQQQLDNLSNLLINSWETDDAALEQYESEMDRTINDNLLIEKEQSTQRLFQSFQTSACAVAQMFKDKTQTAPPTNSTLSPALSSWQSFQNSAGAITVLYKDSLEACKVHMDLGICIGQQIKLKEIINWIKKKKKRTIRKDELISFLIGKQYTSSNQNQMFNLFSQNNTNSGLTNNSNQLNSNNLISSTNNLSISSQTIQPQHQQQQQASSIFTAPFRRQQQANNSTRHHHQQQLTSQQPLQRSNSSASNLALNTFGENSSGSNDSQAVETNSDLATFREALIMHNRSRDPPINRHNHLSHSNHLNHLNNYHSSSNITQTQTTTTTTTNLNGGNISPNGNNQPQAGNCDDLDCFFCEQIATHIEQKRSAASINIDMESPTRKRGRFY